MNNQHMFSFIIEYKVPLVCKFAAKFYEKARAACSQDYQCIIRSDCEIHRILIDELSTAPSNFSITALN